MDRRTFMGAVAGGLVAAPLVARTQTAETARSPGVAGRADVTAAGTPPLTINFIEGVPARVSVAALLTKGDRYTGGYYCQAPGNHSTTDFLPGVGFDHQTLEITYDGSPLSKNSYERVLLYTNPNTSYFIASETGPYNLHWQFPPTTVKIPQASRGTQRSVTNGCKHTRPRHCPYDDLLHIFGGDYSSAGIHRDGSQNGRMLMWKVDPVQNTWTFDYPPNGRPGEDMPLSPDIMGYSWDPTRQIWWITYGDIRGGYHSNAQWRADGGLATAWPAVELAAQTDAPMFVFDPKLTRPKYTKLGSMPWDLNVTKMRESAYDDASKRLYKMEPFGYGIRVYWLDTTPYDTKPSNLAWTFLDIDLRAGAPRNLMGTEVHSTIVGCSESPMHVDDIGRRLFFVDSRHPAIMALTLPGNAAGEHKIQLVADLPGMVDFSKASQGLLACASMPFMWVPEHRCLVLMAEPLQDMVGPSSCSFTIDVDTGGVAPGPRFPDRGDGRPWFPGAGCWFPPTQELIVYGCYADDFGVPFIVPQTMHRCKWLP